MPPRPIRSTSWYWPTANGARSDATVAMTAPSPPVWRLGGPTLGTGRTRRDRAVAGRPGTVRVAAGRRRGALNDFARVSPVPRVGARGIGIHDSRERWCTDRISHIRWVLWPG